jgi:hypothetical protein
VLSTLRLQGVRGMLRKRSNSARNRQAKSIAVATGVAGQFNERLGYTGSAECFKKAFLSLPWASPECLHDGRRIGGTRVDGSERKGAT